MLECNICFNKIKSPIFKSKSLKSITSLCEIYDGITEVYFCNKCGHVQTLPIENIEKYYDKNYNILTKSIEEDDLYSIKNDGTKIYRIEHQVNTLLKKINFSKKLKILDYGCAKGASFRKLSKMHLDLDLYLFDVSDKYIDFWKDFIKKDNWSTYKTEEDWNENFDVVTSFFAFEHISNLNNSLNHVYKLLKKDGLFYFIVPNMFTNYGDFIVVDHINHFSELSINYLLNKNNFEVIEIDSKVHNSAFVVKAKKISNTNDLKEKIILEDNIKILMNKVNLIKDYWENISNNIQNYEKKLSKNIKSAIYGAGFYGTFIALSLNKIDNILYFIDQNPYRLKKTILGKKVISPNDITDEIDNIYIGINPKVSKDNIIKIFKDKNIKYLSL